MLTFVSYLLILVYVSSKVTAFFDKSEQEQNVDRIKVDLFDQDAVDMDDADMQLVMLSTVMIPPQIGSWKAR